MDDVLDEAAQTMKAVAAGKKVRPQGRRLFFTSSEALRRFLAPKRLEFIIRGAAPRGAAPRFGVQACIDVGVTHFIIVLRHPGFYDREGLRLFAKEIMPRFRTDS